ncbi:YjdF family protein [Clostridium sp. P21]|uniref:YjdF family protein n=1 Tax=Clostridium muellerianum TaxID=2716538 RepID=A0A7Y0EJR2_9CLOT|nr:YjdF family protein [Clostridium muellerianum]NMM64751.1 YjdF family protein [Clostridium muellerianum]
MNIKLTVYFEDPFWVGVFEKTYNNIYEVSKVTFGSEPKDYEVYEFILCNFYKLKFTAPMELTELKIKRVNPQKLKKKIKKETENKGISTKAQEAMRLEQESKKCERKEISKVMKEEEKKRQFEFKQQKKKEKKKGH